MTKREAVELVEDSSRCLLCRWQAAGYILRGYWKRVDASTVAKADHIRSRGKPKQHV